MKKIDYVFRTATVEDLKDIVEINNSYVKSINGESFLITELEIEQLCKHIINFPDSISVAATTDNIIVGFVKTSSLTDENVLKKVDWSNESLKHRFQEGKKLYIEKGAVKKEYQRQNIGMFMYESILAKYPEMLFYSFVVKKPIANIISFNFHKKMGFVEAARFRAKSYLGINDYESVMLMKFQ